jgi:hypothetical protein
MMSAIRGTCAWQMRAGSFGQRVPSPHCLARLACESRVEDLEPLQNDFDRCITPWFQWTYETSSGDVLSIAEPDGASHQENTAFVM